MPRRGGSPRAPGATPAAVAVVLAVLGLCSGIRSQRDCFLRLTLPEPLSTVVPSGSVAAMGLTLPLQYDGTSPMFLSGSLFLGFPTAGEEAGCVLPATPEELLGALDQAVLVHPEWASPLMMWPRAFMLEVSGNKNYVSGLQLQMEMPSAGTVEASSSTWRPQVSMNIATMDLQVDVSPAFEAITQDTNTTLTDLSSATVSPNITVFEEADEGVVLLRTQMTVEFELPPAEDDATNAAVMLRLDINMHAEVTLGCPSPCGENSRCALDSEGLPVCQCACGWTGTGCMEQTVCPLFQGSASSPTACLAGGSSGSPSPSAPAGAPIAPVAGNCLPTQMVASLAVDSDSGSCECLPGFYGPECSMCTTDEACQVWAGRQQLPGAAGATCDTSVGYSSSTATQQRMLCQAADPFIAGQMQDLLVTCWPNTTLDGAFTPPPGLLEAIRERGSLALDEGLNICQIEVLLTLVEPPQLVECTGYNCALGADGDTACSQTLCTCSGAGCGAVQGVVGAISAAAITCGDSGGAACDVEIAGAPASNFKATCSASQCLLDGDGSEAIGFSDSVGLEVTPFQPGYSMALAALLAFVVIAAVAVAWVYAACLVLFPAALGTNRSKVASEGSATAPSACTYLLRCEDLTVHVPEASSASAPASDEEASGPLVSEPLRPGRRTILKGVSAELSSGTMVGLMGPSGSGKTTLLNAFMQRWPDLGNARVEGSVLLNEQLVPSWFPRVIGYVEQFEPLMPGLTCREICTFSARLQLPPCTPVSQVNETVESTLQLLGISHIADNIVIPMAGSPTRGVSGGERKRVAVASELVAQPQFLFLDEATSGLDSYLAEALLSSLRAYTRARSGRLVLITVHQPSAVIFGMLDHVLCLADGHLAYSGPPAQVESHFQASGFAKAGQATAPEQMLAAVSSPEFLSAVRSHQWEPRAGGQAEPGRLLPDGCAKPPPLLSQRPRRGLSRQVAMLSWRSALSVMRSPLLVVMHWLLGAVVGVAMGVAYLQVQKDISGIQNRNGAIFFSLIFFGLASLTTVDVVFHERSIVRSEALGGLYNPAVYAVVKGTMDALLLRIIPALLFAIPFYYLMGLNTGAAHVAIFMGMVPTFSATVGWLSFFVCTCSKTPGVANLTIIVVLLLSMLFGGLVSNLDVMPSAVSWLSWLSPYRYAFEALLASELAGETITPKLGSIELDIDISGGDIVQQLGLSTSLVITDILMLNALAFLFLGLASLSLYISYRALPARKRT